jgi:hypothetical protein
MLGKVLCELILCWVRHQVSLLMAIMLGNAPSELIMDVGVHPIACLMNGLISYLIQHNGAGA